MSILIDDIKLNLLLEQKKNFIGKKVVWDSILSSCSFLLSSVLASYKDMFGVFGWIPKLIFVVLGVFFTCKAVYEVWYSSKNCYSYEDLFRDINNLNEIAHNHSIVAIRDSFNEHPNRFLVYDDTAWACQLFINYKDNINNESFIKDHLSRELKVDISGISVKYIAENISTKVSGRDNKCKVYCHKLFLVTIDNIPENMKKDTFECDGRTYHWKSIVELENDQAAMEKNSDIISFVKDNI